MLKQINVFIIDDSASVRKFLSELLASDPSINVIAVSSNPIIAKTLLKKKWPDVFILDIEMPEMDGITFLKEIMATRPTPVIICSFLTEINAKFTIEAMEAGAVDIITKPKIGIKEFLHDSALILIDSVKSAHRADLKKLHKSTQGNNKLEPKLNADVILQPLNGKTVRADTDKIVAIGASAGGTRAIESILKSLPKRSPGIVIVIHMPAGFTDAFAERLSSLCEIKVKEAEENDIIEPGLALIAPGNKHCIIDRSNKCYRIVIKDGPLICRHRPSVDALFRSVAKNAGKNALGIILTGMGDDGATGLLEMKKTEAKTIAQDKYTSVVFGMPKEAIRRGAALKVLPLQKIPKEIMDLVIDE